jgi:hypothetical protein
MSYCVSAQRHDRPALLTLPQWDSMTHLQYTSPHRARRRESGHRLPVCAPPSLAPSADRVLPTRLCTDPSCTRSSPTDCGGCGVFLPVLRLGRRPLGHPLRLRAQRRRLPHAWLVERRPPLAQGVHHRCTRLERREGLMPCGETLLVLAPSGGNPPRRHGRDPQHPPTECPYAPRLPTDPSPSRNKTGTRTRDTARSTSIITSRRPRRMWCSNASRAQPS